MAHKTYELPYYNSYEDEWDEQDYQDFDAKYQPMLDKMTDAQWCLLCLWLYDTDLELVICQDIEDVMELDNSEVFRQIQDEYTNNADKWHMRDDIDYCLKELGYDVCPTEMILNL